MSEVFSKNLTELRKRSGKTQKDMAAIFNMNPVSYGGWERGESEPSMNNLVKLCQMFHVTSDWILGIDNSDVNYLNEIRFAGLREEASAAVANMQRILNEMNALNKKRDV